MNIHMIISKYKNASITFKASVWYTISNILQKLSAFLIIPFLTRMLSTDDYGIYTVFLSWLDIFEIFATMRMYSNGYMAGVVKNESDQEEYTCSIQFLSIATTSFALMSFYIFSAQICSMVQVKLQYMYLMFLSYYATASIGIWSAKQRVNNRYKAMTIVTLCYGILAPMCSIIAAAASTNKLNATIYIRVIVQFLVALPFMFQNLFGTRKKIVWRYCKEAIKYNFPLIPYYLSMVLLNSSDRIMIQRLVGESEAAIYGVAYSLSTATFVFSGALNLSLQPWMFKELKKNTNENRTTTFNIGLGFISILNMLLIITAPELILIIASAKYYEAIWAMPPIIASILIMFIYQQFLNIHFYFGKNKAIFIASIIAAGGNVVMNIFCINWFGYIAAGYTTLLSYCMIAILYYFTMKRICKENQVDYKNYFSMKFIFGDCFVFAVLTIIVSMLYPYPVIRYGLVSAGLSICFIKRKKIILLCKKSGLI